MNFLAHTLFAGDAGADRIGGLLGDFVKGLLPAGLPPDLASGVALHRAIDGFADRHPGVRRQSGQGESFTPPRERRAG